MNTYLVKIDRFFAWVLYASMLIYFVSGYGMTKGVIDAKTAIFLHNEIMPYIIVVSFLIHTGYAIHLAFKRWRIWNIVSKILLILIYLLLFGLFIYIESLYFNNKKSDLPTTEETTADSLFPQPIPSESGGNEKIFTLSELAKYNGKNGMPAYVAVDGIVYDVTTVFSNGAHYSHLAGTELTDEFYSKHVKSQITKYPVVGKLK